MYIFLLLIGHWYLSLFFQTVYLHRYASHNMYKMPFWLDRTFYFLTFLTQGASFLNPKVYAVMHLQHHKHSDTVKDPHSPVHSSGVINMMIKTYNNYLEVLGKVDSYSLKIKSWKSLDKIADSWLTRFLFVGLYIFIYSQIVSQSWQYIFLPIHFVIGPIQGAIVNWCGHKYGYTNYNSSDHSKNTLPIDIFLMGELYQNNHHQYPQRLNFKSKWFEFDFGHLSLLPFKVLRLIK